MYSRTGEASIAIASGTVAQRRDEEAYATGDYALQAIANALGYIIHRQPGGQQEVMPYCNT